MGRYKSNNFDDTLEVSLYTFYLDDSKGDSPNKPRYLVWGGLITEKSAENKLIEKIFELKKRNGLNPFDPIKFNPPNDELYKKQRRIEKQNNFRKQVVSLIASSKVTLIAAYYDTIEKVSFKGMAVQHINDLSIRFQFFIQKKNALREKYRGSMILAYPGGKEALPFSKKYYDIRGKGATLYSKNWHSLNQSSIKLDHLEASVYFSFERHNPLIQLADYIAGSVAFALRKKGKGDEYFSILKPHFRNINGKIKGIGLVAYPHYSREIDRLCRIK